MEFHVHRRHEMCIRDRCSAGFCRIGALDVSYERVYREVDRALSEAKREGKGRCHACAIN